ncbi:Pimeloyl-ACP methyl ester carboxylesterase [Mucilaginibacter sp. OK268]|uniref:alpha/beta fold hydrolase n=1 Tax=Mucilaginibacter sp. OK268 TaxID=1881048 RepID=UPI0008884F3D|nr:alpha/beta hydrolase [Mucilaginibacter sp. OK268]SDP59998.1 Pimeloyl-ACP methyl ester carboxylesterase [Mucilaginibacter sp. OK268]
MASKLRIRGIGLVYEDEGTGDVVVFIHGQPFNRSMWNYQSQVFNKTKRLIIPDLRGYGESVTTEPIVLLDELALDIIYLLNELDIHKAVFVGLSMGGQIALEIYRLAPHLVKGLILADTDARAEDAASYLNRKALAKRLLTEGMEKYTTENIGHYLCENTFHTKQEVVDHLSEMMTSTDAAGAAAVQLGRAERRDHSAILSNIDFPTLLIVGDQDVFTPVTTAEYMQVRINRAELAIIKNAGHMPNMEQPEQFNQLLKDYLDTVYINNNL